ncbi:MAG: T9SS type A sorting domain-containing protein [Saprospiraceae bacterium]
MQKLLLLLLCLPVFAWGQFGPPQTIAQTETVQPNFVVAADLDGDGDLDFLSNSRSDQKIAWHENEDGMGSFSKQKTIAILETPGGDLFPTDIDGDGDLDIVSYYHNQDEIFWVENVDGLGTFSAIKTITTDENILKSIFTADLDSDGDQDVLAVSFIDDAVYWYENEDGAGNFGARKVISTLTDGVSFVYAGDLDDDGDMDVISTSYIDDKVAWYKNEDGQGNFSDQIVIGTLGDFPNAAYPADIDGDGDLDIVSSSSNDDEISLYVNEDGQGNFSGQQIISTEIDNGRIFEPVDLDGDNDLDLIGYINSNDNLVWFENENGTGSFTDAQIIQEAASSIRSVFSADLDGDNDLDILYAAYLSNEIGWYENEDGQGNFGIGMGIVTVAAGLTGGTRADIDGDGDLDIVSASRDQNRISWYENLDGAGEFGPENRVTLSAINIAEVEATDFDGDGDQDLIYYNTSSSDLQIAWLENEDGAGTFGPIQVITLINHKISAMELADLDGDGDADILTSSNQGVRWYENMGGVSSGEQLISFLADDGPSVCTGDIDGDGDLDILASYLGTKIVWYENENGMGSFGTEQIVLSGNNDSTAVIVYLTDIDGDGDLDLVTGDNDCKWYENEDGAGNFSDPQVIFVASTQIKKFTRIDANGDGNLDLMAIFRDAIHWYQNEGMGSYAAARVVDLEGGNINIGGFFTGDIDGDGDLDISYAGRNLNKVVWHANVSDESSLAGRCFLDANENGILDIGEIGLLNQKVLLEPDALNTWTGTAGDFEYFLEAGMYNLSHEATAIWEATSPADVTLEIDDLGAQTVVNFGVKALTEVVETELNITSAPTRCGFTVPFWLSLTNTGTQSGDGSLTFILDSIVTYATAEPLPTTIAGDTLTWTFTDLDPTYAENIKLYLIMPGVDSIGEEISLTAISELMDISSSSVFTDTSTFTSIINCAYDPNDKLVEPNRGGVENPTLFGEKLNYTIRFQNTGTDTAFTVVLKDQLDADLDWSTFRATASSHPYQVYLNDAGLLEFTFNNILLPDSTTNEPESHGFVKYVIEHKENLAENTVLENSAEIYFDFNPPILTNTTINTLVTMLPTSTEDFVQKPKLIKAFPNPFSESTRIVIEGLDAPQEYSLQLLDATGRHLRSYTLDGTAAITLRRNNLAAGLYFYQLTHRKQARTVAAGKLMIQ